VRRVQIIANPIAGGGRARRRAPELAAALERLGIAADLFFTAAPGEARERAAAIGAVDCDAVVAVGGDGTLNEVLNGLRDPTLPLTVLPLGTANVLATELGIPRRPEALARVVARGRTIGAAIGLAGARRFLLFTGAGLDGAMVEQLEKVRKGRLGKARWIKPVLQVAVRWPRHELAVETDSGRRIEGASEVLVTRVRCYGGVMSMPGGMRIDDGALHVLCFRQRTRTAYVMAALRAWLGRLRPGRDVEVLSARALRIDSTAAEPSPYQVDGDLGGQTPVEVALAAETARILAPAAP